jgi:hypothetical protein
MRRLLPVLSITAAACLLAFALTPACSDQCRVKGDCAPREFCNNGACEAVSQDYVSCGSDDDCDPTGQFVCSSGRCVIFQNAPPPMMMPDSGIVTDSGIVSLPDATVVIPDAGTSSTSTTTDGGMPSDAGMEPSDGGLGPTGERVRATINASVTYTEADSMIGAAFSTSGQRTDINASGNVGGVNDGHGMSIFFPAQTTGSFSCTAPNTRIQYTDPAGNIFVADSNVGSCTISVSTFGPVGGRIQGTITGEASQIVQGSVPPDDLTPTISGDFDVIRDMDNP